MISVLALLLFASAFAVTAACTPAVRRLSRTAGWVDVPDGGRKVHAGPVPSVGGVALAVGIVAGVAALHLAVRLLGLDIALPAPAFWFGAVAMLMVGLYDDVRGLGFKSKFAVQLLVAYLLLHAGYRVDVSVLPFVGSDPFNHALLSIPITLLWIVGVINAVNLVDGLDGLAAGVVLIGVTSLAIIFGIHGQLGLVLIAVLICGALVAFLLYNFNPATIFMGDSGSLLLGYLLAVFALEGRGHVDPAMALLIPVVVLGLPLTDTSLSILRRVTARRAVCAPDHDHIHHRLMRRLDHRRAVLVLYGCAALLGLAAAWMSVLPPGQALLVFVALAMLALGGLHRLGYHQQTKIDDVVLAPVSTAPSAERWAESGGDGEMGIEPDVDLELHVERPRQDRNGLALERTKKVAASPGQS